MISGDSVNAILELTYECNFACPFCYVPWIDHPEIRGKELRTEEWKEIIDGLAKADVASLTFTGGEPLMRDDILELIEYAKKKTNIPRIVIYTNLSRVSDAFLKVVDDTRVEISTSIQGLNTLSEMSGCERSMDCFREACMRIVQSNARLSIGVTITKINSYEIENLLHVADSLSPVAIQIGILMIEGRARTHPELWMSYG